MCGQVWDLRTLKLQRCVPCLDSTSLTWNASGDCAYATLRRPSDDLGALLHPKRAKHPLHAAFRTVRSPAHSRPCVGPLTDAVPYFWPHPGLGPLTRYMSTCILTAPLPLSSCIACVAGRRLAWHMKHMVCESSTLSCLAQMQCSWSGREAWLLARLAAESRQ